MSQDEEPSSGPADVWVQGCDRLPSGLEVTNADGSVRTPYGLSIAPDADFRGLLERQLRDFEPFRVVDGPYPTKDPVAGLADVVLMTKDTFVEQRFVEAAITLLDHSDWLVRAGAAHFLAKKRCSHHLDTSQLHAVLMDHERLLEATSLEPYGMSRNAAEDLRLVLSDSCGIARRRGEAPMPAILEYLRLHARDASGHELFRSLRTNDPDWFRDNAVELVQEDCSRAAEAALAFFDSADRVEFAHRLAESVDFAQRFVQWMDGVPERNRWRNAHAMKELDEVTEILRRSATPKND